MSPADQRKEKIKALLATKPLEWLRTHAQNGPTEIDLLYSGCATSEDYEALLQSVIEAKLEAPATLSGAAARVQLCITEGLSVLDGILTQVTETQTKALYLRKQYERIEAILKTPGALNHG